MLVSKQVSFALQGVVNQGSENKLGAKWTLDEVKTFVSAAYSRDAILDVLMGYSSTALKERAIVILGTTTMHLLKVVDWPALEEIDLAIMKSTRVQITEGSTAHSFDCQRGSADELGLIKLFEALDIVAPSSLTSFPIQIAGRTAIILMGVGKGNDDDCLALKALMQHVGEQLEKVIKLAKSRELPPEAERIPPIPERFRSTPSEDVSTPHMPGASRNAELSEANAHPRSAGRQTQRIEYRDPEEPVFPSLSGSSASEDFPFHAPGGVVTGASSTMFGLPLATGPLTSEVPSEGESEPELAPKRESTGTMQVSWDQLDGLALPSSDVEIIVPTSLDEVPNKKTLMGGIAVQAEYLRPAATTGEATPKVEPTVVPEAVAAEVTPAVKGRIGAATMQGGVEAAPMPQRLPLPTGAVPLAGILKTARFTRRRTVTPAGISQVKENPRITMRAMIPLQDPEPEDLEVGAEGSNSTRLGMQEWTDAPKDPASIHDAWFDYFADEGATPEAKHGTREDLPPVMLGPDSEDDGPSTIPPEVLERVEDDGPRTIPPEVLERLLDSGPIALDLQESLKDLESRDRRVAFDAAKVVAEGGEQVIDALAELFPGRLFVDRYQYTVETLPSVTKHGPVLSALVRIGEESLSVVRRYLESPSLDARFYATFLLSEISAGSVLPQLMARLFDKDQQTRTVARTLILNYKSSPQFKDTVLPYLRQKVEMAQEDLQIEVAAEMLGRLHDIEAIPLLISELGKHTDRVNKSVLNSLQLVTFQHPASPYEWRQWWSESQNESRSQWLIKALDSPHEVIRFHAFDEIQRTPWLDLAYHPEQASKLRQRAQRMLELWFEKHPQ